MVVTTRWSGIKPVSAHAVLQSCSMYTTLLCLAHAIRRAAC